MHVKRTASTAKNDLMSWLLKRQRSLLTKLGEKFGITVGVGEIQGKRNISSQSEDGKRNVEILS